MDRSPADSGQNRLLNVQDAAQYLAVSVSTLYGWVWQRKIPFVKLGRAVRFDLVELERFIDGKRIRHRSDLSLRSGSIRPCYNTRAAGKG